jgi:hypothetical protein
MSVFRRPLNPNIILTLKISNKFSRLTSLLT